MKDVIIGIDLGSSNSAVSAYVGNEVVVIPNSEGQTTTPSCVAFTDSGIKVGDPAKRQAVTNPKNTVFNIKRLMGKSFDLVKHLNRPYKIVNSNGRAAVEINGKIYSPEEISAMILQKMKKTAEDYLGHPVTQAIITVPAHFDADERASTKIAGEIAGLEVRRIINEPTAAILNVDSESMLRYLVYDFGGQTFDASIIDVGEGVFDTLGTDGDLDLGGFVIDERIVNYLADFFQSTEGADLRKDPMALQRLYDAAEKAKIELSGNQETDINLPYITAIDNVPKHLVTKLSRAKFEQLINDIIDKTVEICKRALQKAKNPTIDKIMLVGGSSRIPLVRQKLAAAFGIEPNANLNPDTCVSTGATVQGGILSGKNKDIVLIDVVPLSVGIETVGGVFTQIVGAGSTIPCTGKETFTTATDGQTSVELHILQGERPLVADNKSLGRFHLTNIAPAPRGVPKIEVSFQIDANGILSVSAMDLDSKIVNSIRIEGSTQLDQSEIERMKAEAKANEKADKEALERVNKLNSLESNLFTIEKQLKELKDNITPEQLKEYETMLDAAKFAISGKDLERASALVDDLTEKWGAVVTQHYMKNKDASANSDKERSEFEDVEAEVVE